MLFDGVRAWKVGIDVGRSGALMLGTDDCSFDTMLGCVTLLSTGQLGNPVGG